ncbi:MAG: hypothetical protein GWN86_18835, partial [Desulfobacterales bacterium]|nr:hypothetical protein [Desulfobacterales bacterium]
MKELKKTNPLILNIDHVLSFARVREGRVWRLNLSHTPGLQEYIGVLKHLTGLEELEIWRTDVSDLSPLRHLKKLKKLTLGSGVRGNISPLYGLRELLDLYLHADVKDLTPLKGLSKL